MASCACCTNPASRIERPHRGETPMTQNFKLDVDGDGMALVTWDMPGKSMNVIDMDVVTELDEIVTKVAADAAIKGAVITSGKYTFGGGADLTMLEKQRTDYEATLKSKGKEAAVTMVFERSRRLSRACGKLVKACGCAR